MQKDGIRYYKFWYRLLISSGVAIVIMAYALFRVILFHRSGLQFFSATLLDYITIPIILLLIISSYRRSIYYLSNVEFRDQELSINIHKYDKFIKSITLNYNELDVEIYLNLSRFSNYRLEIRKKSETEKFTFDLVHKQFEIGHWKLKELKKLYSMIRERQGKLSNTDHIK